MKSWHAINPLRLGRQLLSRTPNGEHRHVATFNETAIYFTFVFGSTPQSPHAVADRLLGAGIAETVTSPANGEVRMAPRYKGLAQAIRDAEQVSDLHHALTKRRTLAWMSRHPFRFLGLASRVVIAKLSPAAQREGYSEDSNERHDDVGIRMENLIAAIKEGVAERQALNAIQHAREQDIDT